MMLIGFLSVTTIVLLAACAFLIFELKASEEKACEYHKRADEMQRELEPMKMERDEWQQRCEFLTDRLARLEGSKSGAV